MSTDSINPFPEPEYAKLEPWQADYATEMLENGQGRDYALHQGRYVVQQSTLQLSTHFFILAREMPETTPLERSFERGTYLGLAFIALKTPLALNEEQFKAHMNNLEDFRGRSETYAAAAIRLGAASLQLDSAMTKCADSAAKAHPSSAHSQEVLRSGVGYAQTLAERAMRPDDEFQADSIESLNAQYGEELAGIFDNKDG